MSESSAEARQRLVHAWREIKSRPALLPLSWFEHVDDTYKSVEARSKFGGPALPVAPRQAGEWEFATFGRALGMLVGGAFGDAAGSLGEMPIDDLLSAFRSASPDGSELTRNVASFANLARDVAAVPVDGTDFDPALVPGLRSTTPGELGCLAASVPAALAGVSDGERDVFRKAQTVADVLGDDAASAGVLAVALQSRLRDAGTDLNRFVRQALDLLDDGDADLRARLEALLEVAQAGFDLPVQDALGRLDASESVPAALVRSLLLAWRFSSADRAVMHAAASTDRLTAVITGLLMGARDGAGAFPLLWRRKSETLLSLEACARHLFRWFGPADAFIRQTVIGATGEPEASQRFLGAVVGAMIGEALGRQAASMTVPEIQARFDDSGANPLQPVEDDESMSESMAMLAVALDGRIRLDRALVSGQDPISELRATYELWASGAGVAPERAGWLSEHLPQQLADTGVPALLAAGLAGDPTVRPEVLCLAIPAGLWALSSSDVIAHARDAIGVLGESGAGIAPAQALAAILAQTVMTGQYIRGFGQVIEVDAAEFGPGRELLIRQLRASAGLSERAVTPETLSSLGDGRTPVSALAIAACAVQSSEGRFDEALRIAVSHPGNRVVTGMLAGALMGAGGEGIDTIPPDWIEALPKSAKLVFQLAQDVSKQLGDNPPDHPDWNRRYPLSSEAPEVRTRWRETSADLHERRDRPASTPVRRTVLGGEGLASERAQRFLGSVVGAMIGDALGHRVASLRWPEIRERFGESGVTSLEPGAESERMSDGLVMLALSLDGRIRADRARVRGLDPVAELRATYALWTSISAEASERAGWLGKHLPQRLAGSRAVDAVAAGLSGRPVNLPEFLYAAIPAGPCSLSSREVIAHAAQVCGVLGTAGESVAAAQALAVILQQTVMTKNHVRGFGQVVEVDADEFGPGHEEMLHLMRAADSLARPDITPEQIETLGDGSTPASALAIAACAVQSAGIGFGEVLRIAVNHSGNSAVTGALAGAIVGASFEGLDVIPPRWAEGLSRSAKLVFRLAQDVPEQLRDFPRDDDEWKQRYPLVSETRPGAATSSTPSPIDAHERFLGSMLGGAVGDALGFAIEFDDIGMIRSRHGDAGITAPVLRDGVAQVSDDTQMMLFTLEGLIRAHVARRMKPTDNDPVPEVQHAYQRWYHTQGPEWFSAGGPYAQHLRRPDGWLITNWELFASRAPGSTCMSALANFAQTGVSATTQHRINNSKGCGGVMRAAPVAVWSNDPAEVFYAAVGTAALTHSHPSGFLSAGVLSVIVHQLIREVPLRESVRLARELLTRWREHEEQLRVLDKAVALAERGPVSPEEIAQELGGGWVGEEALAIGLYAVLATDDLREALLLSVNHSGDSDSTGIVCGNIGGALYGARAVPAEWLGVLELRGLVETVAKDALAEFSPGPPTDPGWAQRYPAW